MKFCKGGRPITPGAYQLHLDHECEMHREHDARQQAEQARACAYCRATTGELEVINAAGSVACKNTDACQLRQGGIMPAEHLLTVARAVRRDVSQLSAYQLASLVYVLKATVVAAEVELYGRPDRDAATELAASDHAPRRQAWACCTSAIGPVCQHRAEPGDPSTR